MVYKNLTDVYRVEARSVYSASPQRSDWVTTLTREVYELAIQTGHPDIKNTICVYVVKGACFVRPHSYSYHIVRFVWTTANI